MPQNIEDVELSEEFENSTGQIKYKMGYHNNFWIIIRYPKNHEDLASEVARFVFLTEAKKATEILKESV